MVETSPSAVATFAQGLAEVADELAEHALAVTDPAVLAAMQDAITEALLPVGRMLFSLTGVPFVRRFDGGPARAVTGR